MKNKITSAYLKIKANPKRDKFLFWVMATALFAVMLVFNSLTPIIADDFAFSTPNNFIEAWQRTAAHYLTQNGRALSAFWLHCILLLPKAVFNIINSGAYVLLALLICRHANAKKSKPILFFFASLMMWQFIPFWGQTSLWVSGATNYLWPICIMLSFLLPYHLYIKGKFDFKEPALAAIGMFFAGVAAGWGNENTSGGTILMTIFIIGFCLWNKLLIKPWQICGLAGEILGLILILISPGTTTRIGGYADPRPLYKLLMERFINCTNLIAHQLLPLLIVFAVLFFAALFFTKKRDYIFSSLLFFVAGIATIYALVLSPTGQEFGRPIFGGVVFIIVACACAFVNIDWKIPVIKTTATVFLAVLFVLSGASAVEAAYSTAAFFVNDRERTAISAKLLEQGIATPLIPMLEGSNPHCAGYQAGGLRNVTVDPGHWSNATYAAYIGFDLVRGVSLEEWRRIYKDADTDLTSSSNLTDYLRILNEKDYALIICSTGEFAKQPSNELKTMWARLGLETTVLSNQTDSYCAVIEDGRMLYEEQSARTSVGWSGNLGDTLFDVMACGKFSGGGTNIKIIGDELNDDGILVETREEFARSATGLQILAYDTTNQMIADVVCFADNGSPKIIR